jgi:HTH-type transcriptional regulator/antitoxin HipB
MSDNYSKGVFRMYPVNTPQQLRTILRTLRQSRKLTQAQLGERLGVTQKRIAQIEAAPEVTSFDQISRMVTAMGCTLIIREPVVSYGISEAVTNSW